MDHTASGNGLGYGITPLKNAVVPAKNDVVSKGFASRTRIYLKCNLNL